MNSRVFHWQRTTLLTAWECLGGVVLFRAPWRMQLPWSLRPRMRRSRPSLLTHGRGGRETLVFERSYGFAYLRCNLFLPIGVSTIRERLFGPRDPPERHLREARAFLPVTSRAILYPRPTRRKTGPETILPRPGLPRLLARRMELERLAHELPHRLPSSQRRPERRTANRVLYRRHQQSAR